MAPVLPSQELGHLLVAAVRILQHKQGTPPKPEEAAELLAWETERAYFVVRGLVDVGALQMHETPFEVRVEIADARAIERLPEETSEGALNDEVDAFRRADQSRKEELEKLFSSGELERRKQEETAELEKQFERFRQQKRQPPR